MKTFAPTFLTPDDIDDIRQKSMLAKNIKDLDERLKPKIKATGEHFGKGTFQVGEDLVQLNFIEKDQVDYKAAFEQLMKKTKTSEDAALKILEENIRDISYWTAAYKGEANKSCLEYAKIC